MKNNLLRKIPRKAWSFLNIINKIVPKDKKRIFIYSNIGFRDNVKAIFDFLIENGYNEKYKIIVSLDDWKQYAETAERNVVYVNNTKGLFKFFRSRYCYYCFGKYPVKPPKNQIVFNLWHGMPLKRIGNMVKGCEKVDYNYFTYLLCTSEFFRPIMKRSFNATDRQIVICGQPRTDSMLAPVPIEEKMAAMTSLLGEGRNVSNLMLWLPTFREKAGSELDIMTLTDLENLDRMFEENGWAMIVKLHPLSKKKKNPGSYKNICFVDDRILNVNNIDLYQLLAMSSCLVTDYSSVYFDYLLLDRPIGFAVGDMDSYGNDRGFTVDDPLSVMPGEIIKTGGEFLEFARKIIAGEADEYAILRRGMCRQFNKYSDRENCRRAVSMIPGDPSK